MIVHWSLDRFQRFMTKAPFNLLRFCYDAFLLQFLCKSEGDLVCGFVVELGHYESEAMN